MDKKRNIVSCRTLKNKTTNREINVCIYSALQDDTGTWFCLIKIGDIEKRVYGIDSMQAVILSIFAIREVLLNELDGELEWLEDSDFLGFPLSVPMFFVDAERVEIEKKLQSEVDNTLNKRTEELEKYLEKQSYDIDGEFENRK